MGFLELKTLVTQLGNSAFIHFKFKSQWCENKIHQGPHLKRENHAKEIFTLWNFNMELITIQKKST